MLYFMKHKVCICIESMSYVIIVTNISSADIGKGMIMRTFGRIITISINILFFVALATTFGQDEPDTNRLAATVPTFDVSAVGGRMKAEPDGDAEVISSINGKQLPIYAVNSDTDYYLIEFEQQLGWIHKNFVYTDDDLSSLIEIDAIAVSDVAVITRDGDLIIYPVPDADAEIITVTDTETLFIIGQLTDETVYLIVGNGQMGWVDSDSLTSHDVDGEVDMLPLIEANVGVPEDSSVEPCLIGTDQPRTVLVRIGYGENRTSVTTLAVDTEFEALGQNTDDSNNLWFALDKEIAAPGKSIRGDVAWVAAATVETIGDCDQLTLVPASGLLPIAPQLATNDSTAIADNASADTSSNTEPEATSRPSRPPANYLSRHLLLVDQSYCSTTPIDVAYRSNYYTSGGTHVPEGVDPETFRAGTTVSITMNGQALVASEASFILVDGDGRPYVRQDFIIGAVEPGIYTFQSFFTTPYLSDAYAPCAYNIGGS